MNKTDYIQIYNYQKLIKQNIVLKSYIKNKGNIEIKEKIKITIIIYCIECIFLEYTLNSIINQNFINYEIIIIYL